MKLNIKNKDRCQYVIRYESSNKDSKTSTNIQFLLCR